MKPKLAVIEDNLDNRLLVEAILEDDYDISEYGTGLEAVEGLPDNVPDIILLDISLPGMDGTEVLEWIRSQHELSDLPVIALTAHAMSGDRERYIEMGFPSTCRTSRHWKCSWNPWAAPIRARSYRASNCSPPTAGGTW